MYYAIILIAKVVSTNLILILLKQDLNFESCERRKSAIQRALSLVGPIIAHLQGMENPNPNNKIKILLS